MGPRTYDGCNFFGIVAFTYLHYGRTEIGKKAGLFAKLEPGRARKRINAT